MHFSHTDFYTDLMEVEQYVSRIREKQPHVNAHSYRHMMEKHVAKVYRKNDVLKERVKHGRKVTDALMELDEDMKGIRRILPRRRIKAYNSRVDRLAELAPASVYLARNGIWYPDNVLSGAVYGSLALGSFMYAAIILAESGNPDTEYVKGVTQLTVPVMSIMGVIGGAAFGQSKRDGRAVSLEQARYIDKAVDGFGGKILELF